ncbi:hypothetical protein C7S20_14220 [Christiangramia fulva]|uniref:3D domain-containing protein n=1 Tax=Christiangramia fulva TaxID=2126553 RepID=A0A2R3Z7T1_9FLAO|nr:3D domain-containing protein [Christiangramia fulva]AVR46326.1 hypothetical protein C7S20_14220 [Christiangramia fulva]
MLKRDQFPKNFKLQLSILGLISLSACKNFHSEGDVDWDTICVTATAYNSLDYQTEDDPTITAWGDTLKPGMNAIAVSRDLVKLGLDHNSKVKIEGFDSIFLVKDKMHYRWRNRIDIYMGNNAQKARNFGRKKLNIAYIFKKDSLK